MKRIALTLIGKDRPGIIAKASEILYKAGCNIEDTTMTLLGGQFAMILVGTLQTSEENKLKRDFQRWTSRGELHCFWKVLPQTLVRGEKHPAGTQTYIVSVMGKDRTGLVYETSRLLGRMDLNITDLNSKILGSGDKTVFAMVLEVDVPKKFNLSQLEVALKKLTKRLGVDIRLKPLERLSL